MQVIVGYCIKENEHHQLQSNTVTDQQQATKGRWGIHTTGNHKSPQLETVTKTPTTESAKPYNAEIHLEIHWTPC